LDAIARAYLYAPQLPAQPLAILVEKLSLSDEIWFRLRPHFLHEVVHRFEEAVAASFYIVEARHACNIQFVASANPPPKGNAWAIPINVLAIPEPIGGIFEEATVDERAEIAVSFRDIAYCNANCPTMVVQLPGYIVKYAAQRVAIRETYFCKKTQLDASPSPNSQSERAHA